MLSIPRRDYWVNFFCKLPFLYFAEFCYIYFGHIYEIRFHNSIWPLVLLTKRALQWCRHKLQTRPWRRLQDRRTFHLAMQQNVETLCQGQMADEVVMTARVLVPLFVEL